MSARSIQAIARDKRAAKRDSKRQTLTFDNSYETLEEYYKRVEIEGFDLDMTGANNDDPFQQKLEAYPVTDEKWIEFFYNYFNWIHCNFNDCLIYSHNKATNYYQLFQIPFHLGGFDLDFQTNDQQVLNANVELYNNYLYSFLTCLEKQVSLSGRNRDALINMTKAICIIIEELKNKSALSGNYSDYYSFYASIIIFIELAMDRNVLYQYILSNNPQGYNNKHIHQVHQDNPLYGIWLRKSPIWGIGKPQFDHNGLRFFITNYCRELLSYYKKTGQQYFLININTRQYQSLQGGLTIQVPPVKPVKPVLSKSQKTSNLLDSIKNFKIPILSISPKLSDKPSKSIRTIIRSISRDGFFNITNAKPMLDKMSEYLDNNMIDITLIFRDIKIKKSMLLPLPTAYQTTIYHSKINMNLPIFSIFDEKKGTTKKEPTLKKTPIQRHIQRHSL